MMNLFNLFNLFISLIFFKINFMKPKLVDLSQFKTKIVEPVKNPIPIPTKVIINNTRGILINCIFIIFIFIGIYFLYQRYQKKEKNKLLYNKKIENLYNIINKYES